MNDDEARRRERALCRYQVISAYLAIDPPRGRREALRQKLAAKLWRDPDGQPMQVAAETIRVWVRRYREGGFAALMDKPRARPGVQTLSPEIVERLGALEREVPERSLDRLLRIVEETGQVEPGRVTRSTLHRVLQAAGISGRPPAASDDDDLDRFESDAPNALWQSDLLKGPWLPDPDKPGKMRRAHLYAFLDDHSRLLLHGRFSFKGDLPALELVFRRALQKWGRPGRCYLDYVACHIIQVLLPLRLCGHCAEKHVPIGTQGKKWPHDDATTIDLFPADRGEEVPPWTQFSLPRPRRHCARRGSRPPSRGTWSGSSPPGSAAPRSATRSARA